MRNLWEKLLLLVIILGSCLLVCLSALGWISYLSDESQENVVFANPIESVEPVLEEMSTDNTYSLESDGHLSRTGDQSPVANVPGKWIKAKVTAYCPCEICCGADSDGYTARGSHVYSSDPNQVYGLAADPKAIPYGTKVYVPGYWESLQRNRNLRPTEMTKIDDTGGAMRQSWRNGVVHIDVRYRTHSAALKWGVREMWVFVFEE